jgi:hypothetical protein
MDSTLYRGADFKTVINNEGLIISKSISTLMKEQIMTDLKKGIIHLLTLFLLLALASCGGGGGGNSKEDKKLPVTAIDPSTINFIPHLSFEEKVSLIFPESWKKQNSIGAGSPQVLAAFSEYLEGPSDKYRENILLLKEEVMEEVREPGVSNIQEISTKKIEIAGFLGQETIFDADVEGTGDVELRFMEIIFEFNGSNYGLLYTGERDAFERNIDIARHMASSVNVGQVVFDNLETSSDLSNPGKPAVASHGTGFLVVSCRKSEVYPYPSELIGKIVNNDRTMSPEFLIHTDIDAGSNDCRDTRYSAIFDGANYLVTYISNQRVLGKRVTPAGSVIDSSPIDISQNTSTSVHMPDLVFDGTRSLAVWSELGLHQSLLKGAFIDQSGGVTATFIIKDDVSDMFLDQSYKVYYPHIAYGDNQFMVIWSIFYFEDTRRELGIPIFGQLLDLNGNTLLPEPIQIRADSGGNPRYPQIASDGTNYLIGWIEGLLETNTIRAGSFTVYARQVNSVGELVDSIASDTGIEISPPVLVSDSLLEEVPEVPKGFLDLSFYDGSYLFLWSAANLDSESGVYGAKVSQNLESISSAVPISGLKGDTFWRDFAIPTQANTSNSDTKSFILWPSRSGVMEGWFFEKDRFY